MSKTTTKRFMGLLLALVMVFTMLPLSALAVANDPEPPIPGDTPATPGEVKTDKTATPVDGKVNVFDVTLRMEAKAKEGEVSDVVLVMDRSGSMSSNNRMVKAKEAACSFADTLLADGDQSKVQIGLVSYSNGATTDMGLTKDKEALKGKINGLNPGGGTYTAKGIDAARDVLRNSQAKKKYIVLLSDGEPSDGQDGVTSANAARQEGIVLYSIGLDTNQNTFNYLSQIANPGNAYEANPENLQKVFQQIAGSIGSPIQEIKVTDVLGKGFKLVDTNLKPTAGTATYTDANRTITWTAPGLKPLQGQDGLFYAELKYQVTPTDEILNTTKGPNGYYTNESASMTYKDGDTPGTKDFPKPAVDVLLVKLLKEFNAGPNDNRTFTVKVTPAGGQGKDYVLTPGKAQLVTNLAPNVNTYTVQETAVSDGSDPKAYAVTIDGTGAPEAKADVNIPTGNKWGMSDKEIKVINAEKGDGKLTVKKEFKNEEMPQPQPASLGNTEVRNVGGNRGTIVVQGNPSAAPKFKFTFTNAPEGSGLLNTTFELAADEEKTFENLPYGTYTVAEEDTPDFQSEGSQWRVTLSVGHKEDTIVVTNYPKEPETDFTAVKKWVGGKAEDHKKVTLTLLADGQELAQAPAPTVTPDAEPADEYTYKWTGLPNYYSNGAKIKYSVEERNVPEGYAATYNADHTEVTNTNQKEGEINVNKTWTGPEPNVSEIKIRLLKDAQPVPGGEITLKKADGWKGKFEFLDKDLSKYTMEEKDPTTGNWVGNGGKVKVGDVEYDVNIKGTGTSSVNITNAGPDGGLTVRKEWKGAAPTQTAEITVQLLKNNVEVPGKTLTLKASESWTGKFEYLEGDLKEYSVKEVGVTPEGTVEIDGKTYKVTVDASQAAQGKITVTNSHDAGETLTVVKKWIGTAPVNDLIVKLYKGNVDTGKELTLKASENWTGQVTGLEKPLSQYTVKEKDDDDNFKGDGEIAKVSGKEYKVKVLTHLINQGKIGIENTPKGDKTLTVKKEWKGEAGSTVTLYLVKDGAVTSDFITLNAGNKWTDKFENLEGPVSRYSLQELDEASGNPVGSGATVTLGGKTYTFTVDTRKLTRGELKAINTQTGAGGGGGTPPSPTPHPHWYPDF